MPTDPSTTTLSELIRAQAQVRGDRIALIVGARTVSFRDLNASADRVASALTRCGCGRGTRVAVLARDSEITFAILFGAARVGAVLVPINWRLTAPEIGFMLEDSQARILFLDAEFSARVAATVGPTAAPIHRVVLYGATDDAASFDAWVARSAPPANVPEPTPDDVAVQMYTSGTTGNPKGVLLPHRSLFAVMRSLHAHGDPWIGWSDRDVGLQALPSFHIGGLWWAVTTLFVGATNVVLPAFAGWQALDLIARHRVTKTCFVPSMIQLMLAEPNAATADVSSLDTVVYGGSPIPTTLLERALARFRCRFFQIYGLTETGNTAVCLRHEDHVGPEPSRRLAAGRPYPGVDVKCVDASGATLPPGAIGEICIRSPANMIGYWNRPDATRDTLRDGFVHTGDAGTIDADGYVFISDRVKDMIIHAGENVYPAEVENALSSHPAIAEVAVIGIPDERWGEAVKALVVLVPGASVTPQELARHARARIADFKVPKSVDFVTSLPRTPSGKLRKAELREPYWRGRERRVN